MELNSTITDTCKLCTFGSLLGCLVLLLVLNQTDINASYFATRNMTIVLTPSSVLDTSTSLVVEPLLPSLNSNFTLDHQENPNVNVTLDHQENPNVNVTLDHKENPYGNITLDHKEGNVTLDHKGNSNVNVTHDHKENPNVTNSDRTQKQRQFEKLNISLGHIAKPVNNTSKKCNIFKGRWVYKPEQAPSYDTNTCPFLEEKMSCQSNGRPDSEYERWIWEATNCNIPLFNGTDMLERLRNKRVVIVGDSLNRNMWESLACLLYTSIPSSRVEVKAKGSAYKVLKAKDYNCVIEFYWSPFLIELNEHHESGKKVLILDKLSASSKQWKGADVMVFNSGHWWIHLGKFKSWDLIEYEGQLTEEMPIELAYERGMKTWANWIEHNIDPKKTTVFFRSISPEHKREQWCHNVTQPIMDESYKSMFPNTLIKIIEGLIKGMSKLQVKYLNITKLSSYRRDAHPSVYRSWKGKIYDAKYKRLVENYADCSHWCLPGLPDTWNRLLYASLFFHSSKDMSS